MKSNRERKSQARARARGERERYSVRNAGTAGDGITCRVKELGALIRPASMEWPRLGARARRGTPARTIDLEMARDDGGTKD